jgi:dephospho-CoA kinase
VSSNLVVGLTGGIGSGKSAVCREFERLGVAIIDADIVAREVVAPGTPGLAEVVTTFGKHVLGDDGTIDRTRLRSLVFADDAKRSLLEAILHPKIRDNISRQLAAVTGPYCILCIPLLVEKGGYANIGRILVVDCSVETQIQRVMKRDNLTRPQVEAIMRSQATREERLRIADDVIENSHGIERLQAPVAILHKKYLNIAG